MSTSKTHPRRLTVYRKPISAEQVEVAEKLCNDIAGIEGPLGLEGWTSSLLGRVWERRHIVSEACATEVAMLAVGERMMESFAKRGGVEAKTALTAVAQIDRGPLGLFAGEMATALTGAPIPDWVARVGTARIVEAYGTPGAGPEEALLLVPDRVVEPHMLAVFISELGIAKHLSLTRRFDPMDPPAVPGEPDLYTTLRFRPLDLTLACRRVRLAIERSDEALARHLGPGFAEHRALALSRIAPPGPPRVFGNIQVERNWVGEVSGPR